MRVMQIQSLSSVAGLMLSEIIWQKLISASELYAENKTILVPASLIPENSYQLKCELYALNSPYNITYAVDTFIAKSKVSPPTPGGGGGAASTAPAAMAVTKIPELEIAELFPMEINVERGGTTYLMESFFQWKLMLKGEAQHT